jgi:hypothetical protein
MAILVKSYKLFTKMGFLPNGNFHVRFALANFLENFHPNKHNYGHNILKNTPLAHACFTKYAKSNMSHDRPIAGGLFLTWRNMANLLEAFDMERF